MNTPKREGVPRVAVFIHDGETRDTVKAVNAARRFRYEANVTILAVAIGDVSIVSGNFKVFQHGHMLQTSPTHTHSLDISPGSLPKPKFCFMIWLGGGLSDMISSDISEI